MTEDEAIEMIENLKSDYDRIEIPSSCWFAESLIILKSDYDRIEMTVEDDPLDLYNP